MSARDQVVPEPWVVVRRSVAGVSELPTRVGLAHLLFEVDARSPVLGVIQHAAALPVQADVAKLFAMLRFVRVFVVQKCLAREG